jgi:hypothetical protein
VDAFARFISLHAGHRHYSPSDVANLRLVRPRLAGAIKEHEKVERILHIFEMNLFPEMLSIKQSLFSKLNFLILPLEDTIKNQVALKRATGDVHKIWRDWNFLLLENQLEDSSSVHSFLAFIKGCYYQQYQAMLAAPAAGHSGVSGASMSTKVAVEREKCKRWQTLHLHLATYFKSNTQNVPQHDLMWEYIGKRVFDFQSTLSLKNMPLYIDLMVDLPPAYILLRDGWESRKIIWDLLESPPDTAPSFILKSFYVLDFILSIFSYFMRCFWFHSLMPKASIYSAHLRIFLLPSCCIGRIFT